MANETKKTENAAAPLTVATFVPKAKPSAGVSLVTEEAIYSSAMQYENPATKKKESYPVQGWLLGARSMTSPQYGPFTGFIFLLTEPCVIPKGPGSEEGKILPVGAKIIIPGKMKTEEEFSKYIDRPKIAHLWCQPTSKIKTGNGNTLEMWDISFIEAKDRAEIVKSDEIAALLGDVVTGPQNQLAAPAEA